jgi:hypothetical protein
VIRFFIVFFLIGIFQVRIVFAFPEMIRYGYVNCGSCHISQTGGGLLNDYGREIVREKLALFKSKDEKSKEHLFAYGALSDTPLQKTLQAGGDFRSVYYYRNDPNIRLAKTVFMQGDLEFAHTLAKKLTLDATLGIEQPVPGQNVSFIARRHYAQYALNDVFNLRIGKYFPAYGIKTPDHISLTRGPLQLGDNFESYNIEANFINDEWSFFVTGILGRYDDKQSRQDRGFAVQGSYSPSERSRIGANLWYGERPTQQRTLLGFFGLWGITQTLSFQSEIDYQYLHPELIANPTNTKGFASTQKLSYELLDGLWVFGQQEYGKFDLMSDTSRAETYGFGFQIFPRSHFEFNIAYEKTRSGGPGTEFADYAWFMSHFYL